MKYINSINITINGISIGTNPVTWHRKMQPHLILRWLNFAVHLIVIQHQILLGIFSENKEHNKSIN